MKNLGYGKDYAYNPDYRHPVHNVSPACEQQRGLSDAQDYLPESLLQHSSFAPEPQEHFLRSQEEENKSKTWDDSRLTDWEEEVNHSRPWAGRLGTSMGQPTVTASGGTDIDGPPAATHALARGDDD